MEPHSLTDDTPEARKVFEGQIRESFGRVVYTHKTHEKCADILLAAWSKIKWLQIILSALSAGGFIATVFGAGQEGAVIGVIVSTLLLALNTYTKSYDHGELAQKHKQTAANLWLIRERYFNLLTDIRMGERPIEALQEARDAIVSDLHGIYSNSPATTGKAYAKAQDALKTKEDMTFSEEEIDAFLPRELKRGGSPKR